MRNSGVQKIMRIKAENLLYTQSMMGRSLSAEFDALSAWEDKIKLMPTRGSLQRSKQEEQYRELDAAQGRLAKKLGNLAIQTFGHVRENAKMLTPRQRRELLKDRK